MKKALSLVLALCLSAVTIAVASGCTSSDTPKGVTKVFLDGIQNQDTAAIKSVFDDNKVEIAGIELDDIFDYHDSDLPEETKKLMQQITEKLVDFDYQIDNEAINGDKAIVAVTLKTYDFGTAITNAISSSAVKALSLTFAGATEEQIEASVYSEIVTQLEQLTEKTASSTANLTLHKTDGTWKMDSLTDASLNAIFGNLVTIDNLWSGVAW